MRAIIPVAGIGTRLRPHTHTTPKVLLHVAGKPMLGHLLDELVAIGIREVTLIIGYLGDRVIDYVEKEYPKLDSTFVVQKQMLGLGHAISLADENQKGDAPGLIILGDTMFDADLKTVVSGSCSMLGVKEVEDARRFGVIETNAAGRITRLIEKAEKPPTNLALVGIYFIRDMPLLFRCLGHLMKNDIRTKGEFQLTDALQGMLDQGHEMGFFEIDGWFDCGKRETLLQTNRDLLDLKKSLHVDPAAPNLTNCVVRQPVVIHKSARASDSILGPYASIGPDAVIEASMIRSSILGERVTVRDAHLADSVLSDDAGVVGRPDVLNLGDRSSLNMDDD